MLEHLRFDHTMIRYCFTGANIPGSHPPKRRVFHLEVFDTGAWRLRINDAEVSLGVGASRNRKDAERIIREYIERTEASRSFFDKEVSDE